jgi:DNA-binding CsgD family transcriptional regulator
VRQAIAGRTEELAALERLLDDTASGPAALILEGEPGIGKTTLLDAARDLARARRFTVLTAQPAPAEIRLAHAGLADLLGTVETREIEALPGAQRHALDAALLRGDHGVHETLDRRAVAAAFLTLVEQLARTAPVLIAIDDLQWLDPSSAAAVTFALRRVTGTIGLVAARHPDPDAPPLGRAATRLTVGPLARAPVQRLVRARLGRTLPPAVAERVERMAGGNPLFAIEIARTIAEAPTPLTVELPATLKDLVAHRLNDLPPDTRLALAVAAALDRPADVALIQKALPDVDAVAALTHAERRDIIAFAAGAVHFTHPLLAAAVADGLQPAQRRAIHGRLADLIGDPEQRALHLARATVHADLQTVAALDDAAVRAADRGAPAAAAELLEHARALGADTPERRALAAVHHFDAGDAGRARALLESAVTELDQPAAARGLLGTIRYRDGSYVEAGAILTQALQEAPPGTALAVTTALELSFVLANQGLVAAAAPHVDRAAQDAAHLGDDGLLAQALTVQTTVAFLLGRGLDDAQLSRARALEDHTRRAFVPHQPSMLAALLYTSVGRTDEAWAAVTAVRERCRERGEDSELFYTAIHSVTLACWRGDVDQAAALAGEAAEQADQLGTRTARAIADFTRALVAAWTGDVATARAAGEASLATFFQDGSMVGAQMPLAALTFLDLSLNDPEAAADRAGAFAAMVVAGGDGTDPAAVPFVADAAEALAAAGRTEEAAPIVAWLRARGDALDRPFAQATGARAQALLLAAHGDLAAAEDACVAALGHHDRLTTLPLERARTLLALGRIRRRRRQRRAAREALEEAATLFADLHAPLWTAQADEELARVQPRRTTPAGLTDAERRIGRLTAEGLTNREVAASLFVSPRTVEATLARVYRKLEIGSRAELGRHMAQLPE